MSKCPLSAYLTPQQDTPLNQPAAPQQSQNKQFTTKRTNSDFHPLTRLYKCTKLPANHYKQRIKHLQLGVERVHDRVPRGDGGE